jgi:uncharacterized protein YycO
MTMNVGDNVNAPVSHSTERVSFFKKAVEKVHHVIDTFTPQSLSGGGDAGSLFTNILDIRVPTTTKEISEENRQKILNNIQPGDIILETNNAYPGWQRFEKLFLGSNYTHAAIYEGDGKFIEATTGDPSGKGVVRSDLKEYIHGRVLYEIIRPEYQTPEDKKAALDYARSQLGKPYDSSFNLQDTNKQYCAGLVYKALQTCPHKIDVPLKKVLGRLAVAPDSFQQIKDKKIVYSDNASFIKNMASHYPVALGTLAAAAIAGVVLGPIAAVGGFVGGLLFSVALGNKIQTGHFNFTGDRK